MTDKLGDALNFSAISTLSVADPPFLVTTPVASELSGVVLNQNGDISTTLTGDITLPTMTIEVRSTVGFPSSGQFRIGTQIITYTNKTDSEFSGCSGGAGFVARDALVFSERIDHFVALGEEWVHQHWRFPINYPRGTATEELRVPPLTGLQVDVGVEVGYAVVASLDWRVDYLVPGTGWVGLAQGTEVGAPYDGEHVWFDINFEPVDVTDIWTHRFRFGIRSREFTEVGDVDDNGVPNPLAEVIEYDGSTITTEAATYTVVDDISPVPLVNGGLYPFLDGESLALLAVDIGSGAVYYGKQQGVTKVWFTAPNPYAGNDLRAYGTDGVEAIQDIDLNDVSLKFRILGAAPTDDIDCFGNDYRNVVITNPATNLEGGTDDLEHAFWLSKPNPSQFGVESLYFDIRDGTAASVVDHILVDPATPGPFFTIYFSNDPSPGTNVDEWDQLLWTRVDRTFQLRRRESIVLPEPITAKYLKVEFTRLQPRYYAPGILQEPMVYRKHPKWVLDYFLAQYEVLRLGDFEYSDRIRVEYNAYDLAYSYFLDDLDGSPNPPPSVDASEGNPLFNEFLKQEAIADRQLVDQATENRIQTSFAPYLNNPFLQGRFEDILNVYNRPTDVANYSVESIVESVIDNSEVTSIDRESLVIEKQFPVTSFYLTCRHFYRHSQAEFEEDRAYFVGLKEIAFTRDHYATQHDHTLYIESAGDTVNIERNDFESVDLTWATYDDTS